MVEIDQQVLEDLYSWIDQVPLSRPKKDLKRDFSDGVLVAEVVKHYHPHLVELHNYTAAHAISRKTVNWKILNRKVFKKLGFELSDDVIHKITTCKQWAAEQFLLMLREKVTLYDSIPDQQMSPPNSSIGERSEYGMSAASDRSSHNSDHTVVTAHQSFKQSAASQSSMNTAVGSTRYGGDDKMVPQALLDEKMQELLAKDETIQILQAKVQRLERLVNLKDIRVKDLQTRLLQLQDAEADNSPADRPRIIHR